MKSRYPKNHPFYGFGPEDGLHVVRNKWTQRSFVEEQSRALAEGIGAALSATRRAVRCRPARGKGFRIGSHTHATRKGIGEIHGGSEREIERQLYDSYGPDGEFGTTDVWGQLIAFQVPLFDRRARSGWGHIDLLALTSDGRPVVIELKNQDAKETPLRAMIEGCANAVAVEENWTAMSREIGETCASSDLDIQVADAASPVTVLALAPEPYWKSWEPDGEHGQAVKQDAREAFRGLRTSLADAGYPTQMATFDWPFVGDPKVRLASVDW